MTKLGITDQEATVSEVACRHPRTAVGIERRFSRLSGEPQVDFVEVVTCVDCGKNLNETDERPIPF